MLKGGARFQLILFCLSFPVHHEQEGEGQEEAGGHCPQAAAVLDPAERVVVVKHCRHFLMIQTFCLLQLRNDDDDLLT